MPSSEQRASSAPTSDCRRCSAAETAMATTSLATRRRSWGRRRSSEERNKQIEEREWDF
ncbi:hypothetical protein TIFTF001_005486 [Ficus carica]|uniref:Uncharacterized protein n=1 Tax=Ficus carica TaxID=3494 RepID=A0AA87ZM41_FICCA|nr:hypothetical protein TIFTF001_005486 [Ficus carica]